jgi:hypothetical protein
MEAIQKRVNSRFFHEKMQTLKKNIFYKSPQNGQIGKLLLSVSTMETKSRSIKTDVSSETVYLVDKYV